MGIEVVFANKKLKRLETDVAYRAGFSQGVVTTFRKRMQYIRCATDERDFYALKALHYEKLKGKRKHQRSMQLDRQFRIILEVISSKHVTKVTIIGIEDYH